jgi:hypothetical protein
VINFVFKSDVARAFGDLLVDLSIVGAALPLHGVFRLIQEESFIGVIHDLKCCKSLFLNNL